MNGVNIIATVSAALKFKKQQPLAQREEILGHINQLVRQEHDERIKLSMLVATNRALDFLDKHPDLNDKAALQHVMANLTDILKNVSRE